MANRRCWNCDITAHMTSVGDGRWLHTGGGQWVVQRIHACDECGYLQIAMARGGDGPRDSSRANQAIDQAAGTNYLTWWPAVGVSQVFDDVPEHIAEAASEAHRCFSINAYRGATAIARAVIEATAKEKGIAKGQIYEKIEALHEQGFIREHIREGAHEIRHLGNEVAHGDFVEAVDPEEAAEILALMGEVLQEVFQSPARVARARAAREARKAARGNV